jgi:hypothetical protein
MYSPYRRIAVFWNCGIPYRRTRVAVSVLHVHNNRSVIMEHPRQNWLQIFDVSLYFLKVELQLANSNTYYT